MKAIKFSEKELELLKEQYREELASAQNYVEQIREILKKLGSTPKSQKNYLMRNQ
ncbi:MAG: hypothetical protein IPH84_19090 [Bacteroidales bacterium]|nr:hypothetical protein [Bacteroidales bacterium]